MTEETIRAEMKLMLADIPHCLERLRSGSTKSAIYPEFEVYPYRDHQVVKCVGMDDYAWEICSWRNSTSANDVIGFFEALEKKIRNTMAANGWEAGDD